MSDFHLNNIWVLSTLNKKTNIFHKELSIFFSFVISNNVHISIFLVSYIFVTQEYKDDNGILWGKVPGLEGLVEPNQTLNWSRARNTKTNQGITDN